MILFNYFQLHFEFNLIFTIKLLRGIQFRYCFNYPPKVQTQSYQLMKNDF